MIEFRSSDRSLDARLRFALSALVAGSALLVFSGCSDLLSFTIEEESGERKIEGNRAANMLGQIDLEQNPFQFDIDLERELEQRDADGASGVFLENLEFTLDTESGSEGNFDFLDSVTVVANAEGRDEVEIGEANPVPEGRKRFALDVDSTVDLKPFVERGLQLRTEVEGRPPEEDRTLKALITLRVEIL